MKLLIDMNLSPLWISVLAEAGWEAVHCTQDVSPAHLSRLVVSALRQFGEYLEKGALITIDEKKFRARILPFRK